MPVTTASGNVAGGSGVGDGVAVGKGVADGEALVVAAVALGEGLTLLHPARMEMAEMRMTARRLARLITPVW
jgi:hypothetical protein